MDWEDGDSLSFGDSERFDEDSLCSWMSERESICNHWRGWKKPSSVNSYKYAKGECCPSNAGFVGSLTELAAREVATHIPFEVVENVYPPVPEQLQLRIAFWSFPENEEDIRLYSCLATGSADEFTKGEHLFRTKATKDLLQIGFHLSATVKPAGSISAGQPSSKAVQPVAALSAALKNLSQFNVAVTFDRRRITSCNCTCASTASWCSHVVAVCLHRIHQPNSVLLRAPVSESLSRLHRDQLQKFAQYLISELPQQILPTAQRLLDELLSNHDSDINTLRGAPDPTAGASILEQTTWCLDEGILHESIRKILVKLSMPSPIVFSDVNFLSTTSPPAASEWTSLLRPLRGREPEGIWNLLSMVREMFRRADRNAVPLLELITEEVLACETILVWWFNTKVSLHTGSAGGQGHRSSNNNGVSHSTSQCSQHTCASLCDEIVMLWRLAALNPGLSGADRSGFFDQMCVWHCKVLESVYKNRNNNQSDKNIHGPNKRWADIDVFPGFKPALESCLLDWVDYPIDGVTFVNGGACRFYSPYLHLRQSCHQATKGRPVEIGRKSPYSPSNVLSTFETSSTRSSLSSEGFNENLGACAAPSNVLEELKVQEPGPSRRPDHGNLEAAPNSNGQVAGQPNIEDEYNVYFYDPIQARAATQNLAPVSSKQTSPIPDRQELSKQIKKTEDKLEILFSRAEALHAHGHTQEACKLAYRLAQELLTNPPSFELEATSSSQNTGTSSKSGNQKRNTRPRFNPASHQASLLASATLSKAAFLCQVLGENHSDHHYLAFRIGLFGLELIRPPASTKPLEVRLVNQEQDLVTLLKKIPLGQLEMQDLRERAMALRDRRLVARGEALLPLQLATYIFDALVLSKEQAGFSTKSGSYSGVVCKQRLPGDEELGFEAAVAALGLKANVSEAEHPLLCEGTRRQRGELAITLLIYYKDDRAKLPLIMDRLLDKEVHRMSKNQPASSNANLYGSVTSCSSSSNNNNNSNNNNVPSPSAANDEQPGPSRRVDEEGANSPHSGWEEDYKAWEADFRCTNSKSVSKKHFLGLGSIDSSVPETTSSDNSPTLVRRRAAARAAILESDSGSSGESSDSFASSSSGDRGKTGCSHNTPGPSGLQNTTTATGVTGATMKNITSREMCSPSIQQSATSANASAACANETTQNQSGPPAVNPVEEGPGPQGIQQLPPQVSQQPGSNNGNNGTSNGRTNQVMNQLKGLNFLGQPQNNNRGGFKGNQKRGLHPNIPNQPSEASAHFMFELAKTVFTKAGGNSSLAVNFTQPSSTSNHRGPHRALHMCSFQIGLYALGLTNAVSPNWLSRTYSSQVSWITGQAMEIGCAAIMFLIDTWEGHLTPTEVITLADKASRGRDPAMQRACAELALSCLPHAHALNQNEIQRALLQCKEQSAEMLRRACLVVEQAAQGGGIIPEVLFDVARRWYDLYEELDQANQPPPPVHPPPPPPSFLPPKVEHPHMHHHEPQPPMQMLPQMPPFNYMPPGIPPGHYNPYQLPPPFILQGGIHPAYMPPYPPYATPPTFFTNHFPPRLPQQFQPHRPVMAPMINPAPTTAPPASTNANQSPQSQESMKYLVSAYRVGLVAMDLLAKNSSFHRIHDERMQAKYAKTPPYGEDVKWLLGVAKKLGTNCLQDLCLCVVNSVASPFILYDLISEIATHLAERQPGGIQHQIRSPLLTPLIQKCQQMFVACIHAKMYHITPAEYDDFLSILSAAHQAFTLSPAGLVQFNEHLQNLRRSKSCKKDLWLKIASAQQVLNQQTL